jgi:hypothetical protein
MSTVRPWELGFKKFSYMAASALAFFSSSCEQVRHQTRSHHSHHRIQSIIYQHRTTYIVLSSRNHKELTYNSFVLYWTGLFEYVSL